MAERRSPKPKAGGSRPSTPANLNSSQEQREKTGTMKKIIEFAREVQRETLKVIWPTRREIGITTLLIFVMAILAAIFFFFVDWGVSKLIKLALGLGG